MNQFDYSCGFCTVVFPSSYLLCLHKEVTNHWSDDDFEEITESDYNESENNPGLEEKMMLLWMEFYNVTDSDIIRFYEIRISNRRSWCFLKWKPTFVCFPLKRNIDLTMSVLWTFYISLFGPFDAVQSGNYFIKWLWR